MPLDEEQQQAIRDEEYFRNEVRKEIAGKKEPPTFLDRVSAFLETKAGFWLLTTVLAGLTATGFTAVKRYIDRDAIAQTEIAERARRDMETVLKLGPMLTSDKRSQVDVAIVLLDGLASDKALDARIAAQVRALFQSALLTGNKKDASEDEKNQAAAILAYTDRARMMAIQRPESELPAAQPAAQNAVSSAIDNSVLPVRVYMQIASKEDKPMATAAAEALRKADLIVPGIEIVPASKVPQKNDLRYCEGKVDAYALEQVKNAVAAAVIPAPKIVVLDPKLCTKVRFNQFEIWYARPSG
ncbi:MAG: hypothetical protein Q7R66_15070 [Undibacterium sp.]|uniref:hypothetical protein n=1 Tax=Undibacterium sp. TaxID=1914977 RepID=UPI002725BB79|nr:hypothetical protein [Undibacterium sp.]MDO8653503.1 hypothetical protein [Undibacterium sp.]